MKTITPTSTRRYIYNASGALVAEYVDAATTPEKEYLYGASGLLATVDLAQGGAVRYLTPDHLGTPRVVTDGASGGSVVSRHDYLPFGGEIGTAVGNRSAIAGYGGVDNVRQQFTSYERDGETGLDFAQARYYGSALGRFTSPDPVISTKYRLVNPQAWNRYSYVTNTPLKFTDPSGEIIQFRNKEEAEKALLLFQKGLVKDQRSALSIEKDKSGNYILRVDAKAAEKAGSGSLLGRLDKAATTARVGVVDFVKRDTEFVVIKMGIESQKQTTSLAKIETDSGVSLSGLTLPEYGGRENMKFNLAGINSAEPGKTRLLINTETKDFSLSQALYAETLAHFQTFAENGDVRFAVHPRVDADEQQIVETVGQNEKQP